MKKAIVIFAIVWLPFLASAADWKLYYEEKDPLPPLSAYPIPSLFDEVRFREGSRTPHYYDLASVVRIGGVVRTWTKMMEIPKKFNQLDLLSSLMRDKVVSQGETAMKLFMSTFATEETHFYYEINCAERSYRRLDAREFDRSGYVVLGIMKPILEIKFIEPDSEMEKLYNFLCR
jgi:hypothetical protein